MSKWKRRRRSKGGGGGRAGGAAQTEEGECAHRVVGEALMS